MLKVNWKRVLSVTGILVIGLLVGMLLTVSVINKRFEEHNLEYRFNFSLDNLKDRK